MSRAMTMGAVFEKAVERFPERTALVDPDGDVRYAYGEWDGRVSEVGAALQAAGVGPGDTVGALSKNRAELLTLYWAVQRLGAAFAPFNFRAASGEASFLVNNVGADVLFFSAVSRESVLEGHDDFEATDRLVYFDDDVPAAATGLAEFVADGGGADAFDPPAVDPADTSLILHTSGTTGNPKGVPISHRANYARTVGNPIHLDWSQGESTLGMMPNFHEMGRAAISSAVLLNGAYVAQRQWSPEQALEFIEDEEIDILYLVPTLFHDLVDFEGIEEYDVSSVRKVGYAGTAMSERVHREVQEIFEPEAFVNFYGSSEMNAMTTCRWVADKPGCAGRAGIHTRLRVVTPVEGETVPPDEEVDTDELGEIILDADSEEAFDGYLGRPEANETSFEDGWYFTGDLGYLDEDGDLWVVGRVDDMIISGGENIYPVEIEDVLDSHDMVEDVAVGSLADERWGEVVTAYVQPPEGATNYEEMARTFDDYCVASAKIADFKRPRRYVFVDAVPKSNVGKKLRRKLRVEDLEDVDVTIFASVGV